MKNMSDSIEILFLKYAQFLCFFFFYFKSLIDICELFMLYLFIYFLVYVYCMYINTNGVCTLYLDIILFRNYVSFIYFFFDYCALDGSCIKDVSAQTCRARLHHWDFSNVYLCPTCLRWDIFDAIISTGAQC